MISREKDIKIKGIVATIPDNMVVNLDYISTFGEKEVKKQIKVTGVETRCVAKDGQRGADLCIASAEKLIDELKWNKQEIRALIFVTSYPSFSVPSTSFMIQERLGIGNDCIVFDINLACSGYVVGLESISAIMKSFGEGSKGLLLVADVTSESVDVTERATSMLFGDCGSATAVEIEKGNELIYLQKSDGKGYKDIFRKNKHENFQMNGMSIFNFAITDVISTVKEFFKLSEVSVEEIDFFVLHQAQKFIVDKVVDFSEFPKDKCLVSYDKYGNTGCASIPLTLCEHKEKFKTRKSRVFLCAFGAGHSWGCLVTNLDQDTFYYLQKSNEKY